MYGRKANGQLKQSELEEARLGFIQFLRRKRFSPQFIASHGDDLFATAALEYSRKVAGGEVIDSPAGWLITCAWRRTKSLLEAQGRSPQIVSTDKAEAIEDELGRSPEDVTIDEDRLRKVQEAVDQLTVEEQRLLELAYFEGMAVREAARELHWHPSKAQRCHEAARKHLHQLLGVDSLDELEIIVGLAAYISVAEKGSTPHLPAGVEAVAETISRAVSHGWARAQDLARRLPFGGGGAEPSATAAIGGSAGRAAGVCATAALACLASGVVGPGVGGVIGGGGESTPPAKQRRVADTPRVAPLTPRSNPTPTTPEPKSQNSTGTSGEGTKRGGTGTATASEEHTKHATQAVESQSLESAAGGSEVSSAPVESTPVAESSPSSSESSASSSSSTPTQVANQQFGP